MHPDRTWIVISCIPTVHRLLSHASRPYMNCYLMYPDRTWIVISCIPTVHELLSHVSRPYLDCYLMYPDHTWISISSSSTIMLTKFSVIHIWIRILEALTNITHAIQNQVVLAMQRLKLNASNKQHFIAWYRIGTCYLMGWNLQINFRNSSCKTNIKPLNPGCKTIMYIYW